MLLEAPLRSLVHCAWCDGPMVHAIPNFVSKNNQHFSDSQIWKKYENPTLKKNPDQSANPVQSVIRDQSSPTKIIKDPGNGRIRTRPNPDLIFSF